MDVGTSSRLRPTRIAFCLSERVVMAFRSASSSRLRRRAWRLGRAGRWPSLPKSSLQLSPLARNSRSGKEGQGYPWTHGSTTRLPSRVSTPRVGPPEPAGLRDRPARLRSFDISTSSPRLTPRSSVPGEVCRPALVEPSRRQVTCPSSTVAEGVRPIRLGVAWAGGGSTMAPPAQSAKEGDDRQARVPSKQAICSAHGR